MRQPIAGHLGAQKGAPLDCIWVAENAPEARAAGSHRHAGIMPK